MCMDRRRFLPRRIGMIVLAAVLAAALCLAALRPIATVVVTGGGVAGPSYSVLKVYGNSVLLVFQGSGFYSANASARDAPELVSAYPITFGELRQFAKAAEEVRISPPSGPIAIPNGDRSGGTLYEVTVGGETRSEAQSVGWALPPASSVGKMVAAVERVGKRVRPR